MPQNKFAGLFKQFSGKSFSAYVQDLRFQYANELLVGHPDWSVDAVIKACGMSRTSFYNSFFQKFGVKPKELRKNMRKEPDGGGSANA